MVETKRGKGFIGVNLAMNSDMTLKDRLDKEVKADPEMNQSLIVRLALRDYFAKLDEQKSKK